MLTERASIVHRVRIRTSYEGSHATELRIRANLGSADLQPAGLPRAAILIVRTLDVRIRGGSRRDDWEQALQFRLGELARVADQPADCPVRQDAPAVLFRDESEMLACLLRDWARGEAAQRWWWLSFCVQNDIAAVVARTCAESPACLPGAVERLFAICAGMRVLGALPESVLRYACTAITTGYGLRALSPVVRALLSRTAGNRRAVLASPSAPSSSMPLVLGKSAPWLQHAPELEDIDCRTPAAVLAWLSLTVRRAPAAARSEAFARTVHELYFGVRAAGGEDHQTTGTALPPSNRETREPAPSFIDAEETHGPLESKPVLPAFGLLTEPTYSELEGGLPVRVETTPRARTESSESVRSKHNVAEPLERVSLTERATAAPASVQGIVPTGSEPQTGTWQPEPRRCIPGSEAGIETELGGTFFLINAAIQLEIYADFTRPLEPRLALPVWDFLALIIPRLIESCDERDQLWRLLAQLAGRSADEPPGTGFERPAEWSGETLDSWMDWFVPILRDRLHAAIGADSSEASARLVIRQHARVAVAAGRVDVHYSLAAHPISIRTSGLDRDPGWVPAGGRSVFFHFE